VTVQFSKTNLQNVVDFVGSRRGGW